MKTKWCITKFIDLETLSNTLNEYLINDVCGCVLWGGFCRQKYFQRRALINDAWTAPLVTILGKLVVSQLYLTKNHLDATNGMLVYVNFNYSCWAQLASLQMITHRWHLANVTNAGKFCSTLMVAYKAGATASGYFLVCVVQVFRSQCKLLTKFILSVERKNGKNIELKGMILLSECVN